MTYFPAQQIIPLIDLTSLNATDTEATIMELCQKAVTPLGNVAAVCIYPQFIKLARQQLAAHLDIQIATVCNFPSGAQPLKQTLQEINSAIEAGADEIDAVMPYTAFMRGEKKYTLDYIAECKSTCNEKTLKVILETGALQTPELIASACHEVITAGADFLKTSTGKYSSGASLEAAEIMLKAIRSSDYLVGFKAAGGVRTLEQAHSYIQLAQNILGEDWVTPFTFRIGASQLLDLLVAAVPTT